MVIYFGCGWFFRIILKWEHFFKQTLQVSINIKWSFHILFPMVFFQYLVVSIRHFYITIIIITAYFFMLLSVFLYYTSQKNLDNKSLSYDLMLLMLFNIIQEMLTNLSLQDNAISYGQELLTKLLDLHA